MSEGEGGKGRSVELCESVEGMWWPRMGGGEDHGDVDGEGEVGGVKKELGIGAGSAQSSCDELVLSSSESSVARAIVVVEWVTVTMVEVHGGTVE